ncbi:golvesin C-terminal-like domain-containing protein [Cohnella endophytica]|nr:DUF642 domain-containing protein [Cohnella endophytica]
MSKRFFVLLIAFGLVLSVAVTGIPEYAHAAGTTYYVSSSSGNDSNNGTSSSTPWKTLVKASNQAYGPGDQILLKRGDTWTSEGNVYDDGYYSSTRTHNYYRTGFRNGSKGDPLNPIVLGAYGTGAKPVIKGTYTPNYSQYNSNPSSWKGLVAGFDESSGANEDYFAVFIQNPHGWKVQDLKLSNAQGGIVLWNNAGQTNDGTTITNIDFADIDGIDYFSNDQPDGTNPGIKNSVHFRVTYSAGVILTGDSYQGDNGIRGKNIYLSNLRGVRTKSLLMPVRRSNNPWELYPDGTQVNYQNVNLTNSSNSGGTFGWWMQGTDGGTVSNVISTNSGESPYSYGPTGGGVSDSKNLTITNNEFIGSSKNTVDGCGLDFEGNNENVTAQNNIFKNNHSGGIMYFGTNGANRSTNVVGNVFIQNELKNFNNGEVYVAVTPDANSSVKNNVFEKAQGHVNISGTVTNSGNINAVSDTLIVDDYDAASVNTTGIWTNVPASTNSYQTPYLYGVKSAAPGSGATMTFNPVIPATQSYNVYAWWAEDPSFATAATYTVYDGTNSSNVSVDQTTNGGKWNLLGTYTLRKGASPYVKLTAASSGTTIGDAIKIVPVAQATRTGSTVFKLTNEDTGINGFSRHAVSEAHASPLSDNTLYNINGDDPYIFNDSMNVSSDQNQMIIKLKNNTASTQGKIYFKTSGSNFWDEAKSKTFTISANDSQFKTYAVDMTTMASWTGTITGIRFDIEPGTTTGSFNMGEIYLFPILENGNFEAPGMSGQPNGYAYNPTGGSWTFGGYAGLVLQNNGAWGTPAAPDGTQMALLQKDGTISQTFVLTAGGTFKVSFKAARRTSFGGQQTFNVLVDGTNQGTFSPSSGTFGSFATSAFTLGAGSHTIMFQGATTTDNTAFIDSVQLTP